MPIPIFPTPFELIKTFPVELNAEEFPIVRFCILVVCKIPVPVRYVELFPLFALMDAVGVPLFTLITANLEELVAVPPIRRSTVELIG